MVEEMTCSCKSPHRAQYKLIMCASKVRRFLSTGEGEYVYINLCDSIGPRNYKKYVLRVYLIEYEQDAVRRLIDDNLLGCGPQCSGAQNHFLYRSPIS